MQVLLTSNIACWRTANFWKPTKEGATTSAAVYVLSIVLIVGAVCSYLHSHHSASSWHLICTVLRCSYTQLPLQSDSTNDTSPPFQLCLSTADSPDTTMCFNRVILMPTTFYPKW